MKKRFRIPYLAGWVLLASGMEFLFLDFAVLGFVSIILGTIIESRSINKEYSDSQLNDQLLQMQNSKHWYRNTVLMAVSFLSLQIVCAYSLFSEERYFLLFVPFVLVACTIVAWKEFMYRYKLISEVKEYVAEAKKKTGTFKRDEIIQNK